MLYIYRHIFTTGTTVSILQPVQSNTRIVSLIYSKNTFRQGVSNDGGSHVETSSICVVPLGIIVVSSITFVRHLYVGESGAALVLLQNRRDVKYSIHIFAHRAML